jgi:hypothetical protein
MPIKQLEITVISEKSSFKGQLETLGDIAILGSFTGNVKSGSLEINKDGKAVGSVEAENVTIAGCFEGEIVCLGLRNEPFQKLALLRAVEVKSHPHSIVCRPHRFCHTGKGNGLRVNVY